MSLWRSVKTLSGQDVHLCQVCFDCDTQIREGMDIPLSSIVQLVLQNDAEVLDCLTLWSDLALQAAHGACKRGLELDAIMQALRQLSSQEVH